VDVEKSGILVAIRQQFPGIQANIDDHISDLFCDIYGHFLV